MLKGPIVSALAFLLLTGIHSVRIRVSRFAVLFAVCFAVSFAMAAMSTGAATKKLEASVVTIMQRNL